MTQSTLSIDEDVKSLIVHAKLSDQMTKYKYAIVDCPVCGGKLRVDLDAKAGKTSGMCEMEGCLQWVE